MQNSFHHRRFFTFIFISNLLMGACESPENVTSVNLSASAEDDPSSSLNPYYQHGTPSGDAPWDYYLTSYGGSNDSCYLGTPACGGKAVDGNWYYATGAYTFGCNSKLELSANGKCVVVDVVDNGPADWVESNAASKCGGTGYIIDASPLVSQHLFGTTSAGWSDCLKIKVRTVDKTTASGPATCSGTTTPTTKYPVLNIKVEVETITDQTRDFCVDNNSKDVFDWYANQQATANVLVKNEGTEVSRNTTIGVWFEEPFISAVTWQIETDYPNHDKFVLNDTDSRQTVARNNPGAEFKLNLGAMSPGETKKIKLTVRANKYSIGQADHPDIRAWVAHVDNYYEKASFSSSFNNVSSYQKQNGGDLRAYFQTDVFSAELPDGLDNDCNGQIDEETTNPNIPSTSGKQDDVQPGDSSVGSSNSLDLQTAIGGCQVSPANPTFSWPWLLLLFTMLRCSRRTK